MKLKIPLLIVAIFVASILITITLTVKPVNNKINTDKTGEPEVKDFRIADIAKKITVRVSGDRRFGSGVIIAREEKTVNSKKIYSYLVLTSRHNLEYGTKNKSFHILTPDGLVYPATLLGDRSRKIFPTEDLDVIYFQSYQQSPYEVVTQSQDPNLLNGQNGEATVAGFPCQGEGCPNINSLTLTKGEFHSIEKPLKEGYQIGFNRDFKEGTSGGPFLNNRGELIGIVGVRKDVYYTTQYVFADESKPSPENIETFKKLSWAIPLKKTTFDSIGKLLKEIPVANNNLQIVVDSQEAIKKVQIEKIVIQKIVNEISPRFNSIDKSLYYISLALSMFFACILLIILGFIITQQFKKKSK